MLADNTHPSDHHECVLHTGVLLFKKGGSVVKPGFAPHLWIAHNINIRDIDWYIFSITWPVLLSCPVLVRSQKYSEADSHSKCWQKIITATNGKHNIWYQKVRAKEPQPVYLLCINIYLSFVCSERTQSWSVLKSVTTELIQPYRLSVLYSIRPQMYALWSNIWFLFINLNWFSVIKILICFTI